MVFVILLSIQENAFSQTCCTAGMPVSSVLEIPKSNKSLFLNVRYEYRSINRLVDNNRVLLNDPRRRYGQNLSIKTDYVINESWAFSAILPYIQQSRSTFSDTQKSFGIGDLSLLGQYSYKTISLSAGMKLPTGQVDLVGDSGLLLSPDMMSGSGSYDMIFRVAYTTELGIPFLSTNINASYKINGVNNDFGATDNFDGRRFGFGNEFNMRMGFNYTIVTDNLFVNPHLGLNYRTTSPNTEQQVDAPNSGGHWFNLPLGVSLSKDGSNTLSLFTEIPIYQNLVGLQITTDYVLGLNITYKIPFKTKNDSNEILDNFGNVPTKL